MSEEMAERVSECLCLQNRLESVSPLNPRAVQSVALQLHRTSHRLSALANTVTAHPE